MEHVIGTEKTYLGREIVHEETFPAGETFEAYYAASHRLKEMGYSLGSMCRQEPIGFADSEKYTYIAKWYNISSDERKDLDGVMIPIGNFRDGGARIIFFNKPKY